MLGYWNKPKETAQALRDGWMYTGDGGYLDEDGFLYIVDRIKDMIVSGGENIYSNEVENAILSHPNVRICAVIGIPDEQWGESVHAVVVLLEGKHLDSEHRKPSAVRQTGSGQISRFHEHGAAIAPIPISSPGQYSAFRAWCC
jgi:long-chain acyl-CoA synthetase